MHQTIEKTKPDLDLESPQILKYRKIRVLKDKAARISIGMGGISVIIAIMLIFFYLLYEVAPLFKSAHVEQIAEFNVPAADKGETLFLAVEEQVEKAMRVTSQGYLVFFNTVDGEVVLQERLPVPEGVTVTSLAEASPSSRILVAGLSNGHAIVFKHSYKSTYPNDVRVITPYVEFPVGKELIELVGGKSLRQMAVRSTDSALYIAALAEDDHVYTAYFVKEEDFLTGGVVLERESAEAPYFEGRAQKVLIDPTLSWMYLLLNEKEMLIYDLRDKAKPVFNGKVQLSGKDSKVTDIAFLLGGASLLVGDSAGKVSQWFMVRDDENVYQLTKVRSFEHTADAVVTIAPEERRKGFVVVDAAGNLSIYNATANRNLLNMSLPDISVSHLTVAPRANNALLQSTNNTILVFAIENEHPEVSWAALWQKVWYEGYEGPDYIWQSSAATNDFEPKYSLMPLVFGTLKAAFYAMLIATPLAIGGALYTAYFMAPALRKKVKPAIELMEALPTVILGFLAGLFFAPFMEANLPGVFTILILMPVGVLLFGFAWANSPASVRHLIPEGWSPILLVPVVLLIGWGSFAISPGVEALFFGGDMRSWITSELGLDFDQRNALVVGAAMGFAVIPTIFSITEDAIFSVPKHLSYGSLALGATQWQTMMRVILPTASPGIFSAVMIGMGRAVGETMIVLMATGNTPIMDVNIFEGMRTLSANIAVEMPESEVGSTHFRILFLAAFVLFIFTFIVNTCAEYVRQRLRNKYSVI
ncbi:MAG: ABC transporter permease subunit [Hahellaceae bacterium]|nr:ABC transporter permease subunit [Hahellaceae bacterium]MCP5210716.1 ABC transporter permease subunit [Hahellaceae bacterium]